VKLLVARVRRSLRAESAAGGRTYRRGLPGAPTGAA